MLRFRDVGMLFAAKGENRYDISRWASVGLSPERCRYTRGVSFGVLCHMVALPLPCAAHLDMLLSPL